MGEHKTLLVTCPTCNGWKAMCVLHPAMAKEAAKMTGDALRMGLTLQTVETQVARETSMCACKKTKSGQLSLEMKPQPG